VWLVKQEPCRNVGLFLTFLFIHLKIKQDEKERIKQLFQEGIKNNQDNDDGQQKDCKAYVHG
jgi:hypothetical protein